MYVGALSLSPIVTVIIKAPPLRLLRIGRKRPVKGTFVGARLLGMSLFVMARTGLYDGNPLKA